MSARNACVGIDAGADTVAICVVDADGSVLDEFSVQASSQAVEMALSDRDETLLIGIEAGSTAIHLTRGLRKVGYNVRVLETRHVHAFLELRQNKSDKNDARGIAEILRVGWRLIPEVLVKSEHSQMLRSELVLRHGLMRQRLALEAAIRALLRMNGGRISRIWSGLHLEKQVIAEVDRLKANGIDLTEVVEPTLQAAVVLRRSVEIATRRLSRLARGNDVCRRLMTVPGVGSISALSFYTAIDDPDRFLRNEDVGPYLGLVPKLTQSGQMSHMGRISKRGNRMTRSHLVAAAKVAMQSSSPDSELKRWALSLKSRAGNAKAQIALARKLAVVMLAIWKSGDAFDPGVTSR